MSGAKTSSLFSLFGIKWAWWIAIAVLIILFLFFAFFWWWGGGFIGPYGPYY
ncbi:MAG: hypothetical protein M0Z65_15465 [Firmicutes bacterium]|uniref:Uncharacterized protein n=1 Tax=Melghirimyces thermohalophilus TaxID=1236220 RepID=A0A1G6MQM1_9BACL|nr:hypothetical protein [Melghirimyces thermohalophilus]MDA8354549.1 hypothetical protein [Bacillota bacterium]SDC57802.1 hypothetical protein SAMN04488112_110113 [Melghirimyces thermohalophilus]